ncbi:hypothetical protein FLO80_20110 [Aquicoccus porphyridii]|uniref:Uncharacterized protein n=1 Tax=Aquicoccus porphyridii TaxID=1852029 RepID=A0A5A9YXW7_9RHOB|nr:hypothetical protein [Aquicoccus porphyridii]KAA0909791.1 hypothetical protein FLO80_20110 [Aquicoccus porphyridii]RAI52853.1 hypothetical protein DOO74_15290 [Rhodobacteraceae bacterium AsT-22]
MHDRSERASGDLRSTPRRQSTPDSALKPVTPITPRTAWRATAAMHEGSHDLVAITFRMVFANGAVIRE